MSLLVEHNTCIVFKEKNRTRLDLLSIPQSGGENVKTVKRKNVPNLNKKEIGNQPHKKVVYPTAPNRP